MKQIHVVHIIQALGIGGAEQSLVELVNHSDEKLFRFSVIVFTQDLTVAARLRRRGVSIVHVPKRGKISLHLLTDLGDTLKELGADIVHTHLFTADVWGTLAARRLGIPSLSTEHGFNTDYGLLRNMLKRYVANKSTAYVACSEAVRKHMQSAYTITKPIKVIPNGVEAKRFTQLGEPALEEPFKLAIIGRLSPEKGHAIALRALRELVHYRWRLSIVGDGKMRRSLESLVRKLGLGERVQFKGWTEEVAQELAITDIVLLPSLSEGLATVAREAMMAGRLVVASRTGGLPEFIDHGKTGWLVEPNSEAFVTRLKEIFDHPDRVRQVGKAAQHIAAKLFTVEQMAEKYAALYKTLL